MVAGRAGLGMVLALVAGAVIAASGPTNSSPTRARTTLLRPRARSWTAAAAMFTDHLVADLMLMGKFIVLGSAIAAAMQTLVPQSVFTGVLTTPLSARC